MNIHWGRTPRNRWVVHMGPPRNHTDVSNRTEPRYQYMGATIKYWTNHPWNKTANHSALYADNNFLKKTHMLTDMFESPTSQHSFTMVIAISCIFLFFTLAITVAVIVVCRKKNSVFALQKSEQEDEIDYEMDEINTDIEYTETDIESDTESLSRKSFSRSESEMQGNSGAHRPLVGNRHHGNYSCHDHHHNYGCHDHHAGSSVHQPLVGSHHHGDHGCHGNYCQLPQGNYSDAGCCHRHCQQHVCHCHHGKRGKAKKGACQKMVVSAVLEKHPDDESDSDDSGSDVETCRVKMLNKHYYGLSSDIDSDLELLTTCYPSRTQTDPAIDISEADDIQHCSHGNHNNNSNKVVVDVENHPPPTNCMYESDCDIHMSPSCSKADAYYCTCNRDLPCVLYVDLPSKQCHKLDSPCVHLTEECSKSYMDKADFLEQEPLYVNLPENDLKNDSVFNTGESRDRCNDGRDTFRKQSLISHVSVDLHPYSDKNSSDEISILPKRSASVSENLGDMDTYHRPSSPPANQNARFQPHSCPQTPLTEPNVSLWDIPETGQETDASPHNFAPLNLHMYPYATRPQTASAAPPSGHQSIQSSMSSVQSGNVGFVLSSPMAEGVRWGMSNTPYCSILSLTREVTKGLHDLTMVTTPPTQHINQSNTCDSHGNTNNHCHGNTNNHSNATTCNHSDEETVHANIINHSENEPNPQTNLTDGFTSSDSADNESHEEYDQKPD